MGTELTYNFSGKVVLVTGGSSGIGQATALAFAQMGAWVAILDANVDGGLNTVRLIEEAGGESIFFKCDVADPESIEKTMSSIVTNMGKIDHAFNNAGIEGESSNTTECTLSNWQRTMDINLRGIWLCMKHEIPIMVKNGGGAIVNCASIAGLVGFQNSPAYTASKHGVIGLTKTAALEFAQKNVRVNAVCPGVIQTPMIDRIARRDPNIYNQLKASEPVGRLGKPDEIASSVLWLCSEQSSFVTGHSLVVDGGWVAQ